MNTAAPDPSAPSDAAIAQAYWEISDRAFGTNDDEWVFPALRLVSDRAKEIDTAMAGAAGEGK